MRRKVDPARIRVAAKRWRVRRSTAIARLRQQKRVTRLLAVAVIALVAVGLGNPAASRWCAREAFQRSTARPEQVAVNLWVPGVRCTLEFPDGHRSDIVWPVNW
jgi:hypothetical protein